MCSEPLVFGSGCDSKAYEAPDENFLFLFFYVFRCTDVRNKFFIVMHFRKNIFLVCSMQITFARVVRYTVFFVRLGLYFVDDQKNKNILYAFIRF